MDELDMQLHETLAEQQRALRQMTKAQRHRCFERMFLTDFKTEIDGTIYIVCQHYTPTAKETLAEKTERIAKETL